MKLFWGWGISFHFPVCTLYTESLYIIELVSSSQVLIAIRSGRKILGKIFSSKKLRVVIFAIALAETPPEPDDMFIPARLANPPILFKDWFELLWSLTGLKSAVDWYIFERVRL